MDRATLLDALRSTVVELTWLDAAWVGGSDATGRTDDLSDVDLQLLVPSERVDEAFAAIEACLERIGGIAAEWRVPSGTSVPYRQRFYRPAGAPEHLMVDLCIFAGQGVGPYLDPERHGHPVVWVDRRSILVPRSDPEVPRRLAERRAQLATRLELLAHVPEKELARGDVLAATDMYHRLLLGPLVELLRMRHCPARFDFGLRYLDRDLPPDLVRELEVLCLPKDAEALGHCIARVRERLTSELETPLE